MEKPVCRPVWYDRRNRAAYIPPSRCERPSVRLLPEAQPAFSYAMTYSLTASTAVVVRAGTSPEGRPIGVQIVAQQWREDLALGAAQAIETALGSWQPPPL